MKVCHAETAPGHSERRMIDDVLKGKSTRKRSIGDAMDDMFGDRAAPAAIPEPDCMTPWEAALNRLRRMQRRAQMDGSDVGAAVTVSSVAECRAVLQRSTWSSMITAGNDVALVGSDSRVGVCDGHLVIANAQVATTNLKKVIWTVRSTWGVRERPDMKSGGSLRVSGEGVERPYGGTGGLSHAAIQVIMYDILRELAIFHDGGVCMADLKLENVLVLCDEMVGSHGEKMPRARCQLCDLGRCRSVIDACGSLVEQDGGCVAPLAYRAPEVLWSAISMYSLIQRDAYHMSREKLQATREGNGADSGRSAAGRQGQSESESGHRADASYYHGAPQRSRGTSEKVVWGQYTSIGSLSPAIDMWSLGCLCAELVQALSLFDRRIGGLIGGDGMSPARGVSDDGRASPSHVAKLPQDSPNRLINDCEMKSERERVREVAQKGNIACVVHATTLTRSVQVLVSICDVLGPLRDTFFLSQCGRRSPRHIWGWILEAVEVFVDPAVSNTGVVMSSRQRIKDLFFPSKSTTGPTAYVAVEWRRRLAILDALQLQHAGYERIGGQSERRDTRKPVEAGESGIKCREAALQASFDAAVKVAPWMRTSMDENALLVDLLAGLLDTTPAHRVSARDALVHPYLVSLRCAERSDGASCDWCGMVNGGHGQDAKYEANAGCRCRALCSGIVCRGRAELSFRAAQAASY